VAKMATKGVKPNGRKPNSISEPDSLPDDFPAELAGEFIKLPSQFWGNFGTVAGRALARGGYLGLSVTDDGGSAKLAVRCPYVSFEKRVYKLTDLERLVSYLLTKTQD
jgi:hypothetical protein